MREPHVREPHVREPYVREPHVREPDVREPDVRRTLHLRSKRSVEGHGGGERYEWETSVRKPAVWQQDGSGTYVRVPDVGEDLDQVLTWSGAAEKRRAGRR